jgi:beta-phosphoglucomutase-like phosphatase (HAD superfamily)
MPWREWTHDVVSAVTDAADRQRLTASRCLPGAAGDLVLNECVATGSLEREHIINVSQRFEALQQAPAPNKGLLLRLPSLGADRRNFSVWTSNTRDTARRPLSDMSVARYFDRLVGCDDVQFGRPHHQGWQHLSDVAGVEHRDSDSHELAARAARVAFARVSWQTP